MSPWKSFGHRAAAFMRADASKDQDRIQAVINTAMGELYALRGVVQDWQELRKHCDSGLTMSAYPAKQLVPTWVQRLFLTVDVQKESLYWVIRGWGYGHTSTMIDCGQLLGDTSQPFVWKELEGVVAREYAGQHISAMAIDANYRKEQVFDFCKRYDRIAYAIRGSDTERLSKMFVSSPAEVSANGRVIKVGINLWTLDSSLFKGSVHDKFVWPKEQHVGRWMIPTDAPEDYCRQLLNEQQLTLPSGKKQWRRYGDNHYLDCEMMQIFLSHVGGVADLPNLNDSAYDAASAQPILPPKRETNYLQRGR